MKTIMRGCIGVIFVCLSISLNGQVIKLQNGVGITTLKGDNPVSFGTMYPYQLSLGMDYLNNNWYGLSSEVGYIRKGDNEKIPIRHEENDISTRTNLKFYAHYLTVNTTFRIKKDTKNQSYYIGIGPRLDFKLQEQELKRIGLEKGSFNSVLVGLKCEVGFNHYFNNYMVGLNVAYQPTFNKIIGELHDQTFTFGVVLGYVLP